MADSDLKPFAPGVTLQECAWWDTYTGTLDALVAAGLVQADRVPGAPGQNKVSMVLAPDGSPCKLGSRSIFTTSRAGCKRIRRRGSRLYEVHVWVAADVVATRKRAHQAEEEADQLRQEPAAIDDHRAWYRKGWEAACAVVEHRGYPAPTWDGSPRVARPRPVLPAGWVVIQGGRHA